ncbi:MAG: ATP-binding protein [Oceanipulchritudo sp.]
MISRNQLLQRVETGLRRNPIVALIGPRQCGKTTLARAFLSPAAGSYFDLEDPFVSQAFADPMSTLANLRGLVVIDEAQRRPEIFPTLRVLADRANEPAQFLILGSASPDLSRQAYESLAGRVEVVEMGGFQLDEVAYDDRDDLWLRGGFPRAFLAASQEDSYEWRRQFIRMFLERDLAQLGFGIAPATLGRFWTMLAHYHGQLWNGSEIAASMGISPQSSRNYLDAFEQTFMVRRLLPWHVNVGKRLVKSPKIYFRDSGIFHALQGIADLSGLIAHPKLGASWEGYAIEQLLQRLRGEDAYFYAVHSGSELDLYLPLRNLGIEIKRMDAPKRTRSMDIAIEDLKLKQLLVVYPGSRGYELSDRIRVVPLAEALA